MSTATNPSPAVTEPHENASPPKNPWLCVMVVGFLGLIGLVCVIGIVICSIRGRPIPSELVMVTIACTSALPGFLTVVPRGSIGYSQGNMPRR